MLTSAGVLAVGGWSHQDQRTVQRTMATVASDEAEVRALGVRFGTDKVSAPSSAHALPSECLPPCHRISLTSLSHDSPTSNRVRCQVTGAKATTNSKRGDVHSYEVGGRSLGGKLHGHVRCGLRVTPPARACDPYR